MTDPKPDHPPEAAPDLYPWRLQMPIYASGFFLGNTNNLIDLGDVIGKSADSLSFLDMAFLNGGRGILVIVVALYIGISTDRLGSRRVLLGTSLVAVILIPILPLSSGFWPLLIFETLLGLCTAAIWITLRAAAGRVLDGRVIYFARLLFFVLLGNFVGQFIVGTANAYSGPWMGFGSVAIWTLCGVWFAHRIQDDGNPWHGDAAPGQRLNWRGIIAALRPRWRTHVAAIRLMFLPTVLLALAALVLVRWGDAVGDQIGVFRSLKLGVTETTEGGIIILGTVMTLIGYGILSIWGKQWPANRVFIFIGTVAMLPLIVWPLLPSQIPVFYLAAGSLGLLFGITTPLLLSLISRSVPPDSRGQVEAIRQALASLCGFVLTLGAGLVFEQGGLRAGFYLAGALGLIIAVGVGYGLRNSSAWKQSA
jgi:MFS family permease